MLQLNQATPTIESSFIMLLSDMKNAKSCLPPICERTTPPLSRQPIKMGLNILYLQVTTISIYFLLKFKCGGWACMNSLPLPPSKELLSMQAYGVVQE